ncbi:unnamed protein product [Caenorhabditis angaria]|uniref:T-box domain-containing protein n=1 Tax=Caenorhabditis angaria TaxID=860376 RepID=A0A9P1IFQ8_9PELO|nr:unnamed protein product [Caenorhabditis angaria]
MEVKLVRSDLWRQFSTIQNEMIITKRGRNMFPSLQYRISGLEEDGLYRTSLLLALVDDKKYRYLNGQWDQFEPCVEATHFPREVFVGETRSGKDLMKRGISFEKIKITNGDDVCNPAREIIRIQSMRKYIPILGLYKASRNPLEAPIKIGEFQFEETQFIAVTAYQNTAVKDLKVMNNKYAQGFRDTVQTKRSSTSPSSYSSSEDSTFSPPNEKRQKLSTPEEEQENIYQPNAIPQQQQQQLHPNFYAQQYSQNAHQYNPYFHQQYQEYAYYNQYWMNYANQY